MFPTVVLLWAPVATLRSSFCNSIQQNRNLLKAKS